MWKTPNLHLRAATTQLPRLFDTHCHIGIRRMASKEAPIPDDAGTNGGPYYNPIGNVPADLVYDAGLKSVDAFQKNVQRLIIVGIDAKTSVQAAQVSALVQREGRNFVPQGGEQQQHPWSPWSGFSVGIHPKYAHGAYRDGTSWSQIQALAREGVVLDPLLHAKSKSGELITRAKPVAIGETGLDYFRSTGKEEHETQKVSLKAHVDLAKELDLPIILHVRDAYDDIFAFFKEWGITRMKGVLHCFSSDERHMRMGIDLGLKVSFCGTLTYKRNFTLQRCVASCPPGSLVFETDAPWLPPQSCRGGANKPSLVTEVVAFAAKERGEDPVKLAEQAWRNSCELFQIPTS